VGRNRSYGPAGTSGGTESTYRVVRVSDAAVLLDPRNDEYAVNASMGTPVTLTTPDAKFPAPLVPAVFPQPQPPALDYGEVGVYYSSPGDRWEIHDVAGNAAAQNITIALGANMVFAGGGGPLLITRNFSGYRLTVLDDGLTVQYESLDQIPAGVQGPQGASGTQGAQGAGGSQGIQGPQGSSGAQGTQGSQGAQGPAGGSTGTQGPQGTQGATIGIPGSQGARGPQGAQGSQGAQGPKGVQNPSAYGELDAVAQVTSAPSGSFAPVAFTSNGTSHNTTPSSPTITASVAGTYRVMAAVAISSDGPTVNATLSFVKSGVVPQFGEVSVTIPSSRTVSVALDTLLALGVGDFVALAIEQSSGFSVNFTVSGSLTIVLSEG
jgi:hypothetical protein